MILATTRLRARAAATGAADPGLVVDTLWAHSRAEDQVEHIFAQANGSAIDVVIFVAAGDQATADSVARTVCDRALAANAELRRCFRTE